MERRSGQPKSPNTLNLTRRGRVGLAATALGVVGLAIGGVTHFDKGSNHASAVAAAHPSNGQHTGVFYTLQPGETVFGVVEGLEHVAGIHADPRPDSDTIVRQLNGQGLDIENLPAGTKFELPDKLVDAYETYGELPKPAGNVHTQG